MKFYRKATLAIALVFACVVPATSAVAGTVIVCDRCIAIMVPGGGILIICDGCRIVGTPAPSPTPMPTPPIAAAE